MPMFSRGLLCALPLCLLLPWNSTYARPPIEAIEQAPFLTPAQQRAILYDNAARFLRLSEQTIARHRAM